jgi:phospholipid/cholesterol/gamma-HCH transport system substrate-binding protein
MFKGDRNFAVGLFVSIAITAFVVFVLWLTGREGQEAMTRYTLLFDQNVSGLVVGGQVKYMGMNVGSVIHMDLDKSDGVRVQVDIEILETTPVDRGTYASLASQALTGVAVVNLASEPGQHAALPEPPRGEYPRIPVREVGFAAVMASAPEIVNKLDVLLTRAGEMLNDENRAAVGSALENVETLSAALAGSGDSLAALPQELRGTLAEVQATVERLRAMVETLQPGVDQTLANLNRSTENLASLTGRIDALLRRHEQDMSYFVEKGLGEAPELLRDTREAVRDLEKLLAELKDDPSQLVHRPSVDTLEIDP